MSQYYQIMETVNRDKGSFTIGTASKISVIIPVSENRSDNISQTYYAYKKSLESTGIDYEFLYIIDSNYPTALEELYQLKEKGENIKIIKLAKWFGEGTALSIGFENSVGSIILTLPPYQQVDANDIPKLITLLNEADMVIARRWQRIDSIMNRLQSRLFHSLLKITVGMHFHDLGCNVRAFKRKVLEKVYIYGDQHRFLPILVHRYGFKVLEMKVSQTQKDTFQQFYPFRYYIERALDIISLFFIVKFTKKPLRFFGFSGSLSLLIGVILAGYLFVQRMYMGVALSDRPVLLLDLLLIILGIQLFAIGLVGEIIIFTHAKELKEYTIEEIVD